MADRVIPAPIPDPTTKPFWDAAREGRLMLGRCRDTGRHFFPPRGVSPFTLSTEVDLVEASGRGTVYSFSVMRLAQPYAPAMVELEEGPRIFTNIVDCDLAAIRIGMKVRLEWRPTEGDGPPVPMFAPA
ncbi:Zn-ribbon domain-containing OB-fold protein [Falsiroseomonas sp. CW058]|uniref:Zn-ribbon domain-containing OB-fold protein n=1 Tax=Falsiroseomonas sp. CW058 TaxID=3388664 RepID=UPI003D318FE3